MNLKIRLSDVDDNAVRDAIIAPLVAYNKAQAGFDDSRPLLVLLEGEDGHVEGGLYGRTAFGWLFVELLYVPEAVRGTGVGTELLLRAEREAAARGCHSAWLDTFEFQARGFYERLGYTLFGELSDYPSGSSRYFMKKVLDKE